MKLFALSALLMLTAFHASASEDRSFTLAMGYSDYLRIAQSDSFGEARKALIENPYESRGDAIAGEKLSEEDEKWNTIKNFKKTRTFSGGGFVNTNNRVAVGAFAGYQYEYDEINEIKLNEAYSLKINVNIAL